MLIGIPYPVVYEIHANPINPPTVQIGTVPDYARHGSREENSSPNLNRVCQTYVDFQNTTFLEIISISSQHDSKWANQEEKEGRDRYNQQIP